MGDRRPSTKQAVAVRCSSRRASPLPKKKSPAHSRVTGTHTLVSQALRKAQRTRMASALTTAGKIFYMMLSPQNMLLDDVTSMLDALLLGNTLLLGFSVSLLTGSWFGAEDLVEGDALLFEISHGCHIMPCEPCASPSPCTSSRPYLGRAV
jgi:hypothetical protein